VKERLKAPRRRLGFPALVQKAFSFLESEYGFQRVRSEETFVRYESARLFVNVFHGRQSYELGIELGEREAAHDPRYRPFTLEDLAALRAPGAAQTTTFQASTSERVRRFLPQLADLLRRSGASVLGGAPSALRDLEERRSHRSEEWVKDHERQRVRRSAEAAWRGKDYEKVVSLYEGIASDLGPLERKRRAYAKRQLNDRK